MLYPVYVHPGDAQHAHGLTIPDFPGCFSAADDWATLPTQIQEAVAVYCDGEDLVIPPPTPLEELVTQPDYQGGMWGLVDIRRDGTSYQFGIKLTHLIDTVHFTNSHHSRMLQLADLSVWLIHLCHSGDQGKFPRKNVIDHIRKATTLLTPTRSKIWTTDQSWLLR